MYMRFIALFLALAVGIQQGFTAKSISLIIFILWAIPLDIFRTRFRKIVYQTDSWTIALKPVFWKETKALIGNIYPKDILYIKARNFYRFYLIIFIGLYLIWRYL